MEEWAHVHPQLLVYPSLPRLPFGTQPTINTNRWGEFRGVERILNMSVKTSPCVRAKSVQSCPTLCDPMDCNLPGSSLHGILQARILEWAAGPSSRGSSPPRAAPAQGNQSLSRELRASALTLCKPVDCSMPGFPVHQQLPEPTQTHVHRVGDAIQPSHPLSSPSCFS